MAIGLKRGLKIIGGLTGVSVLYVSAVAGYLWAFESAHDPLPAGFLDHYDEYVSPDANLEIASAANDAMTSLASDLQAVSISGAIAMEGQLMWSGAVGLASVENATPASIRSRYRIGSVSKSLTATALARMVELNMIDLDDSVQKYLPDYPLYESPMTVRQLASHTAGVRHYGMDLTLFPPHDSFLDEHFDDVTDATAYFKDDGLQFPPGSDFAYSTYGYTLLSAVMEAAAGIPFLQLMNELLFEPMEMRATGPENGSGEMKDLVSFYHAADGLYGSTRPIDFSIKWAGGGFVSTPTDLVTLGSALLSDSLIEPETRELFFTPQPLFDGSENPQAYALGWRHHKTVHILGKDHPVDVVHHGGTSVGGVAFFLLVPDHNISIAFMSNGVGETTRNDLQVLAYRLAGEIIRSAS